MRNYEIICPYCNEKLFVTKEELFGEYYHLCWRCGKTFKNLNYKKEYNETYNKQ